ncbi:MAG: hypothetical protein V7K18_09510 [Nostoc sp.]|uniref:hypothetical protein n=1 Tax=Nostoc sp. TaxID=1180 RepID=UPI002FF4BE55
MFRILDQRREDLSTYLKELNEPLGLYRALMSLFTEAELKFSDRLMPLFMSDPIPRWSVWEPFMGWLLKRINDLPTNVRLEVVKLMEIWQVKSPTRSIYRKEIGEIAIAWLKEEEARRDW